MIINQTPRGGFERGRQRSHPFGDVVVDQRLELRRLVSDQEGVDEEEDLRLALAEVPHEMYEQPEIALLLPDDDSRRMFACACEPGTVGRALNLNETLRAAADRADLLAERGTTTPGAPRAAERAQHKGIIV
jgi:hypothetical protein